MAANARAVSVAIVVERKEVGKEYPVQRPVYYISQAEVPTLAEAGVWSFHGEPEA